MILILLILGLKCVRESHPLRHIFAYSLKINIINHIWAILHPAPSLCAHIVPYFGPVIGSVPAISWQQGWLMICLSLDQKTLCSRFFDKASYLVRVVDHVNVAAVEFIDHLPGDA